MPFCSKHNVSMECLAGESADPDNWYCPFCDRENKPTTQSLTDQIKSIPWAPWVKWVAHDENNVWAAFEKEPYPHPSKNTWVNDGRDSEVDSITIPTFPDWRESKIRVKEQTEKADFIAQIKAIPWRKGYKWIAYSYGVWMGFLDEPQEDVDGWRTDNTVYDYIYDVDLPRWEGDWRESKVRVNE